MKRSELRQIIKEEIRRINEDYLAGIFELSAVKELKDLLGGDYKKLAKELERVDKKMDDPSVDSVTTLDFYFPIDDADNALEYLEAYGKLARDRRLLDLVKKYK